MLGVYAALLAVDVDIRQLMAGLGLLVALVVAALCLRERSRLRLAAG